MTDVLHDAPLSAGTMAPEFDLPTGPDASVGLGSLRGRPAVLAFYDLSPIDVNPGADGILYALEDLTRQEAPT